MKEQVTIDGDPHEIELKSVNLIFKSPDLQDEIKYEEDRVVITPELTVRFFRSLDNVSDLTLLWVTMISGQRFTFEELKSSDIAMHHLAGMIEMSLAFSKEGQKFVLRYPETYLHPRLQCNLADFIICLSTGKVEPPSEKPV